jgi:hypothetical protein
MAGFPGYLYSALRSPWASIHPIAADHRSGIAWTWKMLFDSCGVDLWGTRHDMGA